MKKSLLNRYLVSVICLLLFFNDSKAICTTTFTADTINIACGDSFTFAGIAYYLPVTQTDTFIGIHGCDSVVTLYLNVTDTVNIVQGLCAGDSIYFYGNWVKTIATYDTLIHTSKACDSLVTLNIFVVDSLPPTNIYDTICQGDSVFFNGVYLDTAGVYTAHINPSDACDSTVILTLAVKPAPMVTFTWDSLIGIVFTNNGAGGPSDTADWCRDGGVPIFLLRGGNPPGGFYTGLEVSNDTFYAWNFLIAYENIITIDTITYTYTDGNNNCQQSKSLFFLPVGCLGVQNVVNQYSLNLYPNPAQNYLTIAFIPFGGSEAGFTTHSQIEVLDLLGRVVQTEQINNTVGNMQLDIHALSNGMYFLRTVNDGVVEGQGKFSVVR